MKALFAFSMCLLLVPCAAQRQGISGQIYWISGNQMPGSRVKASPQQGVQREVYVYELTYQKDCIQDGVFYTSVPTKLITKLLSHPDGTFKIKLPTGKYSVFVKEPKGLFANLFDQENAINPITVKEKNYTWVTIAIDYEAAY